MAPSGVSNCNLPTGRRASRRSVWYRQHGFGRRRQIRRCGRQSQHSDSLDATSFLLITPWLNGVQTLTRVERSANSYRNSELVPIVRVSPSGEVTSQGKMAKACWAFLALKLVVARGRPIG